MTTATFMRVWVYVCLLCSSDSSLVCVRMRFFCFFSRVRRTDRLFFYTYTLSLERKKNERRRRKNRTKHQQTEKKHNREEKEKNTHLYAAKKRKTDPCCSLLSAYYLLVCKLNQGVMSFYCHTLYVYVRCFRLDDCRVKLLSLLLFFVLLLWSFLLFSNIHIAIKFLLFFFWLNI